MGCGGLVWICWGFVFRNGVDEVCDKVREDFYVYMVWWCKFNVGVIGVVDGYGE